MAATHLSAFFSLSLSLFVVSSMMMTYHYYATESSSDPIGITGPLVLTDMLRLLI